MTTAPLESRPTLRARAAQKIRKYMIEKALTRTFERAPEVSISQDELRVVIFSDHHRGAGDPADDFQACEPAYRAALGWYYERGYSLWLLGDVEELWENGPGPVLDCYKEVLKLERSFGPKRLRRFYGNHDMAWRRGSLVDQLLRPWIGKVEVQEALKVWVDGPDQRGLIFLAHGHQGTWDSGNFLIVPISRFVVRNVWAALQRAQRFRSTSPSTSTALRDRHDKTMYGWARSFEKHDGIRPILIAGHTHHPVFPGQPPPDLDEETRKRKQDLERARALDPPNPDAVAAARAEYELARTRRDRSDHYKVPVGEIPCYFNTGCCSFGDGDVTALELADGKIRLVRWLDDTGKAQPECLACKSIETVLEEVAPEAGSASRMREAGT
jgi:UDP-2,3-diacylglucosamine pyrophosphatase LpxH